ncbi:MAG: alkaline phosphatase, partial [Acidimicrobiales bacterium]|nr:alkaline phosphatase [Acidimicrobiales bacterium]
MSPLTSPGPISRRALLAGAAATVATLRLQSAGLALPSGRRAAPLVDQPFTLGTATGDPTSSGFVAWTRLAPDPSNGGGIAPDPVAVSWEVSRTSSFGSVVRSGTVNAVADLAHTVHVDVDGLDPDSEWFVRFSVDGFDSPVARARTLPASGTTPLRFGFVSCQNYPVGYYTALRGLAEDDVDLWLHLGDYIYENSGTGPVRSQGDHEIITLDDYRNRYGVYKSDPDLQAAHHAAPIIPVWDDHEVDNNYNPTEGSGGQTVEEIRARQAAGYRAWFEHQPVRLSTPTGPELKIYRRFAWGDLATFHMLDGRQYRDPPPCGGEITECDERVGSGRTMLGADQKRWLAEGLAGSDAVWDVIGQQTVFAPMPFGPFFNLDQWDGYPEDRQAVWEMMRERPNPVVCTGDIHAAGVAHLHRDLEDVESERIGTELVGTSVSSTFPADLIEAAHALVRPLPWVEYVNAA